MKVPKEKIAELIQKKKLIQIVLLDKEGFILDSEGTMYDPDLLSAAFVPLQEVKKKLSSMLKVNQVDELSIRTNGKPFRAIMRSYDINGFTFSMILICPLASSYRNIIAEINTAEMDDILKQALEQDLRLIPPNHQPISSTQTINQVKPTIKEPNQTTIKEPANVPNNFPVSQELIDIITYKVYKNLSANFIEKAIQKQVTQITQNMLQAEMKKNRE
jgi:hypothetical protein